MLKQSQSFYIFFFISTILTILFLHFILPVFVQEKEIFDSKDKLWRGIKQIVTQLMFFLISSMYYFVFYFYNLVIVPKIPIKSLDTLISSIILLFCPYLTNKIFDIMLSNEKLEVGIKKIIIFEVLILIGVVGYINRVTDIFLCSIGIIVGYCTSLDDILGGKAIFKCTDWLLIIKLLGSTLLSIILFIALLFINHKYNLQILAIIYGCGLGEIITIFFVIINSKRKTSKTLK